MAKLDLYYLHLTIKKKELVSRKKPFEGLGDFQIMLEIIQGNVPSFIPPSKDSSDMVKVSLEDICRRCWEKDPTRRPTMQDIANELRPGGSSLHEHQNSAEFEGIGPEILLDSLNLGRSVD